MSSPLLLEDHARVVIRERLQRAQHDALVAQATRTRVAATAPATLPLSVPTLARQLATSARVRAALVLRFLARRLDRRVVPESQLLIVRSR